MDKDNYFSSAIVTFPSEGDYKLCGALDFRAEGA